jgi:hypothetical protein
MGMGAKKDVVTDLFERWRWDLIQLFASITSDPFVKKAGRRWENDFGGAISKQDTHYAVFIGVLSLLPAILVANISTEPQWKVLAQFFRTPLQVVISGFLTSALLFLGSHVNRAPRPYTVAFKLMLRLMAIHPFLVILTIFSFGEVLSLLIYGFFVIRGVRKTYSIPLRSVLLFFGSAYVVFALLQLQGMFRTLPPS